MARRWLARHGLVTRTVRRRALEEIENQILELAPGTDAQRWFKAEALKLSEEVMKSRWRILESQGGTVPTVFLVVVISWLTVTFTSFGLYAQPNASVMAVLVRRRAIGRGGGLPDPRARRPVRGLVKISSGPLRFALAQLGQ